MSRHLRTLIIVAGCLVLALDVVTLGYAFTRGGEAPLPKYPGRIAVCHGCGVQHMVLDGTDKQDLWLQGIFDELRCSWVERIAERRVRVLNVPMAARAARLIDFHSGNQAGVRGLNRIVGLRSAPVDRGIESRHGDLAFKPIDW